jgi:iron complex outermembrane receptor protein
VALASAVNGVKVLTGPEFVAAGGTDLGSNTDWVDAVTRTGFTQIHNVAASGGSGNTTFRVSANIREVDGILQNSGFDQFNTRLNFGTRALNDKLKIDFNTSFTDRNQQNGFNEALRYAIIYNPTAPVRGADSPFPFNGAQFGGYFETLGLFDSFNPVSIIEQNRNEGKRKEFNYGANFNYTITDNWTANLRVAEQTSTYNNVEYYPTTSLFRGGATSPTRKGLANLYNSNSSFKLYEMYSTYVATFGQVEGRFTGGYSFQQQNSADQFVGLGDFPNNDLDFSNAVENAQDLLNAGFIGANSNASPDDKIIAFFGRANFAINNAIFINASLRREGSTKLGEGNQWGTFPSLGVGVDLTRYLSFKNVNQLKVRLGYGVTGALPQDNGLSKEIRQINYDPNTGATSTSLLRAANPDLKWEEKSETNLGVDFSVGKLSGNVDVYNRDISDFILERNVDAAVFGVNRRVENAGKLNTKGFEIAVNYDLIDNSSAKYTTGLVLSSYKSTLKEYVLEAESRGELGAPGQNGTRMILVREGEEIGNIWGPRFTGVADNGTPIFADINGDGQVIDGQDKALDPDVDFEVLGNGIPDLELGWNNRIQVGNWSINAFFRGAFGHSLVNTFRAFYEPRLSTQSSYNYVTTDLAEPGLTAARFSSLYVEKADFFKLDNLTISRTIDLPNNSAFKSLNISLIAQNPFVLTSYTGTDPEPSLVDRGPSDNGGAASGNDVLSPGIDRRSNYFASRSITLGVNVNF